MSKIDFIVGIIINYYKFILLGVVILFVVRTLLGYHIKITVEQICPNCNTLEAERIPRNLLEKLIQQFLTYQYYHNPNYIFDIDIIQKQASSEEAEDYLKNGKWKWSNEVEKLYTNYTYQLPFVSISSKTSIENSKKIYNETAITDLMAWNSKEGLFILNGAVIGHSPGLPKNINNQIKCNTKGQMMKIINRDIDIYPGYMIQEKKILPSEDIPKTLAGFQFIDEICNPCIQGGKQNCKFKLNIGDGGEITSIWEYIWGINKKNNKVSQNKVGVQPRNIEPLYDKPNLQVDLNF
jgi:hypothetical protein